jgi:heavy metal translocating P-type ATPase
VDQERGAAPPTGRPPAARFDLERARLALAILGIAGGAVLWLVEAARWAELVWAATTVVGLVPLAVGIVRKAWRREPGVDLIALLAMAGALALGEYLAGAVIAVMLATGQTLEAFAEGRAHRELSALLERAPRTVQRYEDGRLVERPIGEVGVGDRLLVRTGEVVPVDGVAQGPAVLDESMLTGESRPVERGAGERVRSGAVNAGPSFDLRAIATAADSTYAGIVRLVEEAERDRAPIVRLADRYAFVFIPVTLLLAGAAWAFSGDPVRALAVLVVATPCPMILAVPIAIVAGTSRAARRGVIVKGGGALETLARVRVLLLDKTGTITAGRPELTDVVVFGELDPDELLRLAASLDQASPHVLAEAIVRAARARGLELAFPEQVRERFGAGIVGTVEGRRVAVGKASFVADGAPLPRGVRDVRRRTMLDGSSAAFVGVDGAVAGALVLDDPIRPDAPRVIRTLRRLGIRRVVMLTGDHPDVAEAVGAALGVDRVLSERSPAEKVEAVEAEAAEQRPVAMVGDGVNDAPALAVADVGVAMGARGATASSEAADVVLVEDRLDRLVDALRIAKRSRRVAVESVALGMGLAFTFMVAGAVGLIGPVAGAVVQEVIDVASILSALRALRGGVERAPAGLRTDVAERFRAEHRAFGPELARIRATADRLEGLEPAARRAALEEVRRFLVERLPEHEEAEEAEVYPLVARLAGGEDPMSSMARAHVEIGHLTRVFRTLVDDLADGELAPEDLVELRRLLYGLHAILRLHFAQEEEAYAWLTAAEPVG